MDPEAHGHLLASAALVSPALHARIATLGPVWFPERPDRGVAAFLARAVTGQQLSTKAARAIWGRLETAALGGELADLLYPRHARTLLRCGLSRAKVKAFMAIGEAHRAGLLEREAIRALDHEARIEHLTQIRGIGPWTCDMLAIFYCNDPDVWPEGDSAAVKTLRRHIGRKSPHKAAAQFAPWRSLLALYLWKIADTAL